MKSLCKIAIVALTLLHIIKLFMPINLVLLTFFTLLLLVFGLSMQKRGFRNITLFFFALGIALLVYFELPLTIWMQSLTSMTNIIAIIVVMQLFSIPIEVGHYSDTVEYWLKRLFKKESSLYLFAMIVTNLFASFLLFGTVPVMVSLFNKALKNNVAEYQRFFATAIMRGYTLALFWAPGAIIILLVMQVTHVAWSELFLPGLLLSLMGLLTSYLLEHFSRLNKPIVSISEALHTSSSIAKNAPKQTAHILLVILSLIVCISLFENFSVAAGTGRILLAGLIVSTIWIAYYRKRAELKTVLKNYGESGIMQATDFSVFFIAVGLFAGAVDHSGILGYIQPLLQESVNHLGIFSVIVIPLLFILVSICGIHPLVLAIIFGKILLAVSLPLPPVSIALILLLSASISFIISPFAGMSLMTAKYLNVTPLEVSIKWNLLFCTLFLIEGLMFAYFWNT